MVQLAIHSALTLVVHLEYYPGSRPPPEGSLIFLCTTPLGFTAIAYQLRIFLSRTLMFLRQAYDRYFEVSLYVPCSRVSQRLY